MTSKTCAACDYPLDANAISVKIGGKTVDVCCDECATKLQEAHAAVKNTTGAVGRGHPASSLGSDPLN